MNRRLVVRAARAAATLSLLLPVLSVAKSASGAPVGAAAAGAERVAPIVAGYEAWAKSGKAQPAQLGQLLLSELNCTACHAAGDAPAAGEGAPVISRLTPKGAPDLSRVGERMTPQALGAYLNDPHGFKPGGTMPDLFHASEPQAKAGAVDFLVHYLASLGGPIAPATEEGNVLLVDRGRELYHSVGCVACHEPEKGYKPKPAPGVPTGDVLRPTPVKGTVPAAAGPAGGAQKPAEADSFVPSVPLGNLAAKTTADQLAAFLLDPLKARPHGRMPSSNLSAAETRAIAVYLLREQLDNPQTVNAAPARTRGLKFAYYERPFRSARVEAFDRIQQKPKAEGRVEQVTLKGIQGIRQGNFGVRFSGAIRIPADGKYTFYTTSDDGSRLYIDGKPVVDNDGIHAAEEKAGTVDLKAGDYPFAVTFIQGGNEAVLSAAWEGPGIAKQDIPADALFTVGGRPMVPLGSGPFPIDPQKRAMGQQMFALLGCTSCHNTIAGVQSRRPPAKPLAALNVESPEGCLGPQPSRRAPHYHLRESQRTAIKAALADRAGLNKPLDGNERVMRTMAAMNCFACHARDDVGGPAPERGNYFQMAGEFDMGDEGRLPPRLSGVGAKLKSEAMHGIIFEGKLHVRPVLATRMPRFAAEPMKGFVEAVQATDAGAAAQNEPKFSEQSARDGRQLVGTKGLGCVNCHGVAGAKSLGMPGPDLATVHARIKPDWFRGLLHDPPSKNPATRMPAFWQDGNVIFKDLGGGTELGQIDAMYTYLSLGETMPLPAGLQPDGKGYELLVGDVPLMHRTFMGAGVGTRAVLAGFPENVHVAFDADRVRMAKAWRGRFYDARGMWEGRGGQALPPLGTDVIDLPPGPEFAVLSAPDAPWPMPKDAKERNVGGQFKGYRLDSQQRPIFMFEWEGVRVDEQPLPVLRPGGGSLIRRFTLTAKIAAPQNAYFQAASGNKVEPKGDNQWVIDDKLTVRVAAPGAKPVVRATDGRQQLLVPVSFKDGTASFDVEMSW
jgi:mono/diheme cytochrome c family protein